MKKRYLLIAVLAFAVGGRHHSHAQTLDPTFAAPTMYAPGAVLSAVEQADGKRVIAGLFKRINGAVACGVARFNTNGTLDAAFQQNIGTQAVGHRLRLLSNGQLLLLNTDLATSSEPMHVGGINRVTLLKINADGTGDQSFDVGTGPSSTLSHGSFVSDVLPLASGKFIVTGEFDHFNGTAANGIVRLLANGTVDPTFDSGTGLNQSNVEVFRRVVELPNGQLLACGMFRTYNGIARDGLLRLNANGSLDTSFEADFTSSITDIAVQADGKILVRGLALDGKAGTNAPSTASIARLLPNGSYDPTFTSTYFQNGEVNAYEGDAMQLLPNGQILLDTYLVPSKGLRTVRLNSDGTLDQSYQVATTSNATIRSVTQLANGQALIEGTIRNMNGINDQTLLLLNSNGTIDTSFLPVIQTDGEVKTMARQADGKIVVGGEFTQINGQNARRLARFNANGTLDATFQPGSGFNFSVEDLAVQPDGRILTMTINTLLRFESNGAPDNSFTHLLDGSWFSRMLLLADGRLLVGGNFLNLNHGNTFLREGLIRLLSDGSVDNTFTADSPEVLESMAEQPDGKLVVAGRVGPLNHSIRRLTTTGAEDPTFTGGIFHLPNFQFYSELNSVVIQPDGKIVVVGLFTSYGIYNSFNYTTQANMLRLETNGTVDGSFTPPAVSGRLSKVLLQPNGRLLVAGAFTSTTLPSRLARLLPSGQPDASFGATVVPDARVNTLLVQPDGKLVVGGNFSSLSGQASMGLARIGVTNVLHVAAPAAVADRTQVWPVPAHTTLTVAPDASAHPQTVELLDLLGRPVLIQNLRSASPAVFSLEMLRPGTYLLRVSYTEGLVVRRVQVQ